MEPTKGSKREKEREREREREQEKKASGDFSTVNSASSVAIRGLQWAAPKAVILEPLKAQRHTLLVCPRPLLSISSFTSSSRDIPLILGCHGPLGRRRACVTRSAIREL